MTEPNHSFLDILSKNDSIIINEVVFEPSFIPKHLVDREHELKKLASHFKSIIQKNNIGSRFILVQGPVGCGKTVVTKVFGKAFQNYSLKENNASLQPYQFIYINCRQKRSWYLIFTSILRRMIPHFPLRGFSTDELLSFLLETVQERKIGLLLCLDEIDYVVRSNEDEDVLYSLIRTNENNIFLDKDPQLSLILTTRNRHFLDLLDDAVSSSINKHVLTFRSYTQDQLFKIVKQRAAVGLATSSYSDDVLKMISKLAAKYGDARYAIELLWLSAKTAEQLNEKNITFEHLREAQSNVFQVDKSLITDLGYHQKIVLLALAKELSLDTNKSKISSKFLKQKYESLCLSMGQTPRNNTQFWHYLKELALHDLVNIEVINQKKRNGSAKGRIAMISIEDIPTHKLVDFINNEIVNKTNKS